MVLEDDRCSAFDAFRVVLSSDSLQSMSRSLFLHHKVGVKVTHKRRLLATLGLARTDLLLGNFFSLPYRPCTLVFDTGLPLWCVDTKCLCDAFVDKNLRADAAHRPLAVLYTLRFEQHTQLVEVRTLKSQLMRVACLACFRGCCWLRHIRGSTLRLGTLSTLRCPFGFEVLQDLDYLLLSAKACLPWFARTAEPLELPFS